MPINPFEINGWTIAPCDDGTVGYTVSYAQSYTEPELDAAVSLAQSISPKRLVTGTPEGIDRELRSMLTEEERRNFYRWIGRLAVGEAYEVLKENVGADPAPPEYRSYTQDSIYEMLEVINPGNSEYDFFPSKLPE